MAAPEIDTKEIVKAFRLVDQASTAVKAYASEIGLPLRSAYVAVYNGKFAEVTLDSNKRLFKNFDGKRNRTRKTFIIAPGLWADMVEAADAFKGKKR